MPGRLLRNPINSKDPDVAAALATIGATYDDPIVSGSIEFGAYDDGDLSREVTITAVDRKGARYAPTLFRNKNGASPGRWVFLVYGSDDEFGAPIALTPTMTKGRLLSSLPGNCYLMQTESDGVLAFRAVKVVSGTAWVHAGMVALLRSAGIDWTTGNAPDPGTDAGDPKVPGKGTETT